MDKLGGSGVCTSNHLSGTANNITVTLDTIPKAYEGPTAFGHDWTHLSQRVQISNTRTLAYHQSNNESCLRQSMVSVKGQTGQSRNPCCTASLQRQNYPQHDLKHFSSNDKLTVTSGGSKKLQKGPVLLSSSSFEQQNASSASMTTNMTPQSLQHMIVVNSNNLNGNWKNSLSNQQQHLKTVNSLPKNAIGQGLSTDVQHFGVILAPTQTIQMCQENAYMSKDVHQQKLMSQKAIAVVTPLTQDVVAGDTFSNNVNKVKEGVLDTRFVPNKNRPQSYISHMVQSRKNESCVKTLNDNTPQTKGAPVLATHVMRPAENTTFPGQSQRLSLATVKSVSSESKLTAQPYPTVDNCTVTWRHNETTMDVRLDKLSAIHVNEWTLQRLRSLVTDMEQIQKGYQKNIPCNDISSEIVKLYWNGHYQNFCSAAKSDIYINIMKEVEHHCGRKDSVIFQAVSKETLKEVASRFHILEHGIVPPKTVYTSSWLNLSEELYELDKGHDRLSSFATLQPEPKVANQEMPVKEMENVYKPSNEMAKVSDEALRGGEKQSKLLPPEHQKRFSVKADRIAEKEQVVMTVENKCIVREMEGQISMAVNNVLSKEVQMEKQNKTVGENEPPLSVSLNTQSSDVGEISMTPGNLLPTTDLTPVMDKDGYTDCISEEMTILPLEKDRSFVPLEQDEEVNNILKADAQISKSSKGPSTVELFDQDKKIMGTEIKSDERQSKILINSQVENYCCLAKWFQILGYRNGGHCNCEKKAELGHHAETSGKGVKKVKVNKHRHSFKKTCNLNDTETSVLRDKRRAKKRLGYRSMTGKKSVTSSIDDDNDDDDDSSMDEMKIVDVITNSEDVLKLMNTVSEQLMETPRASSSHESTSVRKHCRHEGITTPEFKRGNTRINLALFGTSQLRHKKNISVVTSSDTVHLPPETINVRIDSGGNEYSNSTKSQTSKQQVWNSWKKTHVPLKMSTNRKSKNQKHKNAADTSVIKTAVLTKSTTFPSCKEDAQKHLSEASADKQRNTAIRQSKKKSRRKELCTRNDRIRKLKRKKMLASFNLSKRWNYANNASKLMKSSFPAQTINTSKHKLNPGSALNFNVLPESFNISDDTSSSYQTVLQVNRSASTDSTTEVQPVVQMKRPWNMSGTWCDSPRKKKCLKPTSTIPNTSGTSTFQEFKKKYEEKKQGIPP
ncbi:uncharacterized protein si:ch211-106e7.2 [Clarias gariepinus]|uniref:uncharacterized protein si:ch211-106e7.2 n=1 Tax=Clarias gariepinus TaxID=13013 RepID=UPI00234DB0CF|nr:uncharacterized protein si:ch211-106e7.2 [Clarias gariepinus]XP_053370420.1 uncharacterized protein si:ch211-106e7.2 [Clarias gariepinus]